MKTPSIISIFIFLTLVSCNHSATQDKVKPETETPKALENKTGSFEIISKRGPDDLVTSLYNELVDNTPALKKIETQIETLNTGINDSMALFSQYNEKNQAYFSSADMHIEQIKDSLVKERMKILIAGSLDKYNSLISRHNNLEKLIETKNLTLSDLHTVLKIIKTLPLIDKYQKDNLPSTKPMENLSRQFDETIHYVDTLSKK